VAKFDEGPLYQRAFRFWKTAIIASPAFHGSSAISASGSGCFGRQPRSRRAFAPLHTKTLCESADARSSACAYLRTFAVYDRRQMQRMSDAALQRDRTQNSSRMKPA
jgi:hypothetical protein